MLWIITNKESAQVVRLVLVSVARPYQDQQVFFTILKCRPFGLFSLVLIETRKHAIFVDSETCPSCFHNQELNKMSNSHASLIQFDR